MIKQKFSSSHNLYNINLDNNNIRNENENTIHIDNITKSLQSLNNNHIQNQKRMISKKIVVNNNFFDRIKKIPNKNNYKNQNHTLDNFINKKKLNNNKTYSNVNNISNRNNKSIEDYFGSFDDYFLSGNESISERKIQPNNIKNFKRNGGVTRVNVFHKINKNNTNFNIFNIVKNDKIIQNNFYEYKNKAKSTNNNNLTISNQNSLSYLINNKKILNNKYPNNSDEKNLNEKSTSNKFILNQLQKCSASDLFLPSNIKIKSNINKNIITEGSTQIKKEKIVNNEKNEIIQNNNENKLNSIKYKDDFFYDLFAEKIFEITKVNNSYDEIHLLPKIRKKYNDKYEKIISINKKEKLISHNKKSVKFSEKDNKIIKINQKDIVSKFEVFNNSGKKIYFPKCKINNYMKKLRDKNLKMKSILINKKEEIIDNSEWDKLYDIINKIAKKSENNNNSIKKKKFNIKNIESFTKKGKNKFAKKNKLKK